MNRIMIVLILISKATWFSVSKLFSKITTGRIDMQEIDIMTRLSMIVERRCPPNKRSSIQIIHDTIHTQLNENPLIRPMDSTENPGGVLHLYRDLPTLIIPDLHARMDFIISLMNHRLFSQETVFESLKNKRLQIVCVGDGMHAESRARQRWQMAMAEFKNDWQDHTNMDQEMYESLGLMEMIMELKCLFPDHFHFLKGNHENIKNESNHGNLPFMKFALEGIMVTSYIKKFYGQKYLERYAVFERNLPLLAIGKNFLVSHAEPARNFSYSEVLNYRQSDEVVLGLTWTDNGSVPQDSAAQMLNDILGPYIAKTALYFGGHRPIQNLFQIRGNGKYVQIHNPYKFVVACLDPAGSIILNKDIIEIPIKKPERQTI